MVEPCVKSNKRSQSQSPLIDVRKRSNDDLIQCHSSRDAFQRVLARRAATRRHLRYPSTFINHRHPNGVSDPSCPHYRRQPRNRLGNRPSLRQTIIPLHPNLPLKGESRNSIDNSGTSSITAPVHLRLNNISGILEHNEFQLARASKRRRTQQNRRSGQLRRHHPIAPVHHHTH